MSLLSNFLGERKYFGETLSCNYILCPFIVTGIGPVLNLRFSPSFSAIMWDPPPTVGVLSNLTYHLTVTNMNTGVVIINTNTTDTSYLLGSIPFCTFYNASVTALSLEQKGDTMGIMRNTPGGGCNYTLVLSFVHVYQYCLYLL